MLAFALQIDRSPSVRHGGTAWLYSMSEPKQGVDNELEAAADAFLREHGEEPPRLRPWRDELRAAREAKRAREAGR